MADEFEGSRIFLNIPVFAARDKDLLKKTKSLLLLGEIVSMLNTTGKFFMSNRKLAKRLDCTPQAINNYLQLLEEKGLIVRNKVYSSDNNAIIGRMIKAGPTLINARLLGVPTDVDEGSKQELGRVVKGCLHKESSLKEQFNKTNKRSSQAEPDTLAVQCKEVIEYLNEKTGKHFKPNAKGNRGAIYPRLKEGYTVEDMKIVINNMYSLWHSVRFRNGELGDNYLKPETLFRSSKIDGYLNANPSTANNQRQRYSKRAPINEPTPEWFKREQEQKEQGEPDQGNWMDQLPDESEVQ
ncbi:conserved phage C-terminal domain-containing protein [Limosilactobacillus reuteri]|uniref:conserved phage C-terminal domain-containing protein n=1 Tax=Limosilactobacillus reuteri TaxID=1598 RepID=UPI001E4A56E2|nr:conserved phage C-terminal domain-containing protein [Limosilactobacillus reuteri]MCC4326293.1 conserved phage C-terminal domain-containing protein [Limosilactobacillus reuteri]MCC4330752.1 conserved phage C-terminal domain-containing protein [Limosilactobacillus reuteri]